ncbi:hypothetical protein [Phycisphaera mikurensis]|uniref:STAS domain-containing protein n=1 Tax=Phycisphaera mikurensis (strain NBRC 102666 / KCTC 22515 / FYK2301M01) TaxID=1142394 RepID=I0IHR0_PHYMF|nr:hypothetical protein [Phycisphaera mikurensis]MBB6441042.1 anti-anti-sigma regulatory factor [Phycisphaera mikurensis]BAM04798.1 hypothetical protein PSMK_26390 [Phycisphaera mikurensis NBRC 102666]
MLQPWSESTWVSSLDDGRGEPSEALETLERALQVRAAKGSAAPNVVVDLAGISHLGTVQLDRLRLMRRRLARSGGRLRLAAPTEALWAVILGHGADEEFLWSEDVVGALVEMS